MVIDWWPLKTQSSFQLWPALVSEAIRREGEGAGEMNSDPLVTTTTRLKLLQICANIIDYCRSAMTMGGMATKYFSIKCDFFIQRFLIITVARGGVFITILSYYLYS